MEESRETKISVKFKMTPFNLIQSKLLKLVLVLFVTSIAVGAVLSLISSSPAQIDTNPPMEIPITSQTREFLWSGYDMDELNENGLPSSAKDHRKAAYEFPTTESCLLKTASNGQSVNLTQVAWGKIRSLPTLDVCLYRVASSLGSATGTVAWFRSVGFEARATPNDIVPGGWLIWASWSEARHGTATPFPRHLGLVLLDRILLSEDARMLGVTMHLDSDLQPTSVESSFVLK